MRVLHVLIAVLLLAPSHALALVDIDAYEHRAAIQYLQVRGIVEGYADGHFRPNAPINRAEFLKILMLAVFGDRVYGTNDRHCFTDFTGEEKWYWVHACVAKEIGILHGHPDGTFRGEDTVNLAEALKMAYEAWEVPVQSSPILPWFHGYMEAAAARNIYRLFPYVPQYQLTRGEMAALLVQLGYPIETLTEFSELKPGWQMPVPVPPGTLFSCGNGLRETGEQCDDGNTFDGDGCSSQCVIVSEPVRHGVLQIDQRTISDATFAAGTRDVELLAFDAIAGRQDVYITVLKFRSDSGSLANAENYRLYVDRDGDGTAETLFGTAVAQGEKLVFPDLNIIVKDGKYRRISVRADLLTLLTQGSVALGFDTSNANFVEGVDWNDGEDVSGIELNDADCTLVSICWIAVNTEPARVVTIGTEGNLYVTLDSSPVSSKQILAGALSNVILRLTFRATAEDIRVKSVAIAGGTASIDRLEFTTEGSSVPIAIARASVCDTIQTGQFCTETPFIVPRNGEKDILVRALMNSDESSAVSGDTVALSLTAATTGSVAVEAEGYYSGQVLSQNDGDATEEGEIFIGRTTPGANIVIAGPAHDIVFAKIVDIQNSHSSADGTPVPTGAVTFAQFRLSAANHQNSFNGLNPVVIDDLVFTVSAINVAFSASSFRIYSPLNSSTVATCTESATTGTFTLTCAGLTGSSVSTLISPGQSINLALQGTITDAQVGGNASTLQASLGNLSNRSVTGTVEWTDDNATFGWVDIGKTTVSSVIYRRSN